MGKNTAAIFIALLIVPQVLAANPSNAGAPAFRALEWLKLNANQASPNPLADAPSLLASNSLEGETEYSFSRSRLLNRELANGNDWIYGASAESDVIGIVLYAVEGSKLAESPSEQKALGKLGDMRGERGFRGWFDASAGGASQSSVDTAWALMGLAAASRLDDTVRSKAVSYLYSLQNPDGSFNLTANVSHSGLYSLGPNPESITALVLVALADAGERKNNRIVDGISFLQNSSISCYAGSPFAQSMAAVAFLQWGQNAYARSAASALPSEQHADGGFSDPSRLSNASNPLDTAIAAWAMSQAGIVNLAGGENQSCAPSNKTARVGVVASFANGTTAAYCVTVQNGASAREALEKTGLQTEWSPAGPYGSALAKLGGLGCAASDPWCQCRNQNGCCLAWNLWVMNSTEKRWEFSRLGYSSTLLSDGEVFASVWSGDAAKLPSDTDFGEICGSGREGMAFSKTNLTTALDAACNSCTSNSQCASGKCDNGKCVRQGGAASGGAKQGTARPGAPSGQDYLTALAAVAVFAILLYAATVVFKRA